MRKPRCRAGLVAALAGLATLWAVPRAALAQPSFEMQVVAIVNEERAAEGLSALGTDTRLFSAAEGHAAWMAEQGTLSHLGEGGSNAGDRAEAQGYVWSTWGEVLAAGQPNPEEVVRGRACDSYCVTSCQNNRCDGWKQSSGHWTLLMHAGFRDIGVGYFEDTSGGGPYQHWWAATVANSAAAPTPVESPTPSSSPTATSDSPTATYTAEPTTPTPTCTATATPTRTATVTATRTRTATATNTRTATAISTWTSVPASATPVGTLAASATSTASPIAPTATLTASPAAPTATATTTATTSPAFPTAVQTATAVPPTSTRTATATPDALPPTATATATGAPQPGALILGRVRVQTRSVWGETTVYLDGEPRAITGDDGWFVILGVSPGWHTLRAQRAAALSSEGQFLIQPGVVNYITETLLVLGDVYRNERIDLLDAMMIEAAMGRCVGDPSFQSWIDVDSDGCITPADGAYVVDNFGWSGPTAWSPIP